MTKKSNKFIYVYLGAATLASSVDAQQKQPNIILLTADDLGWNDISSAIATMGNGSKNHQTPNIDKFAAESMVLQVRMLVITAPRPVLHC